MREHEGKLVRFFRFFFSKFKLILLILIQPAVCELCGREYAKWSGLLQHVNKSHPGQMKYQCAECDRTFMYESGLITHRQQTHVAGPRTFICENCGKIFADTYQLTVSRLAVVVVYLEINCLCVFRNIIWFIKL